jgi:two-component system NtrC family sensor kinase
MSAILGNIPPLLDYLAALREMLEQYRHTDDAELRALREKLEIDFILGDFATGLHSIDEAAARVRDIQQDLRSFLRGDEVEQTPADLNEAIRSIVEMLKRGLPGSIAINASFGELPDVCFNSGQMKQVCINLLRNAVDALGSAGTIDLATRATATSVRIQISDSGPGVPAAIRGRIFEPYFTTKDIVSGSGLGLAVCRRIVEDHAGSIRLDETYTNGCRFVIELPMSGGTGGDGRKEAPARAARG